MIHQIHTNYLVKKLCQIKKFVKKQKNISIVYLKFDKKLKYDTY